MSWSRLGRAPLPGLAGMAVAVLSASLLAACTLSPVYAPATVATPGVAADLAAIAIEPPSGRVEQQVRNNLLFAFTGGGNPAPTRYQLRLKVSVSENLLGVTPVSVSPAYTVDVAASYELALAATGTIVTRGVAHGAASYDRSNQGFANERARIEAEDRGAAAAADEIRIRIAAALARPS